MNRPDPQNPRSRGAGERQATVSATEEAIGEIWCEVLGIPETGPEDNFFGLGGNSLNAMQAVARIRRTLACPQVKLADVFRATTLRELAQRVEELSSSARS
jgi:hypothetical protein